MPLNKETKPNQMIPNFISMKHPLLEKKRRLNIKHIILRSFAQELVYDYKNHTPCIYLKLYNIFLNDKTLLKYPVDEIF